MASCPCVGLIARIVIVVDPFGFTTAGSPAIVFVAVTVMAAVARLPSATPAGTVAANWG